jgi:hypothetical protein
MQAEEGLGLKYTYSGSVLFERMLERKLYSTSVKDVHDRVDGAGLWGVFAGTDG